MTAPPQPTRTLEAQLASMLERLDALERGSRATQLGNSSLDGTTLSVVAPDGTRLASWGVQPDGTASTKHTDPKTPPRPNTPVVTSAIGGIEVEWNGLLIQATPGNFERCSIHVSPVEGFVASDGNKVGDFYKAGKFAVETDYVRQHVKLIAWSTAGVASEPSFEQYAIPGKVVADSVLDGIIGEVALADEAVKAAKLATGAVTSTKIGDDAVTTPKLVAGAVQASKLAAGSVLAEKIAADAVTADKIAALSITSDKMTANAVTAGKIEAGAVKANHLESTMVLGNRLIAGTPTGPRVELSSSGLIVVRDDGDTTFSVDSSTGDVTSMGEYYTSRFGERLAMNSGGLQSPTIRAYPNRGARYADLRSYTRTLNGTDIANWEFRVPLAPGVAPYQAGLVDFCVYNANFVALDSSRLRYRPFDNGSGNVHCGWAADGQNAAVVFWQGTVWATNSANTAGAPFNAGTVESRAHVSAITNVWAGTDLGANGRMDCGGHSTIGAGLKVGQAPNAAGGQIQSRELTTVGNMACGGNFYLAGSTIPTSDARMKYRFRGLEGSPLDAFRDLEWRSWEWLPSPDTGPSIISTDDRRHVMATAQDMLEHPLFGMVVVESDAPGDEGERPEDVLGFDLESLVGIQGAALHEAGDRIASLEAQVAALTERLEALEQPA
jgi:hypothetical protein